HPIEQVRREARAGLDGSQGVWVRAVSVANRCDRTGADDVDDQVEGAGQFRCDSHAAQTPPRGFDQSGERAAVGQLQELRILGSSANWRKERSLEMGPHDMPV